MEADAEEASNNAVKSIKAEEIDSTFRSECIGM